MCPDSTQVGFYNGEIGPFTTPLALDGSRSADSLIDCTTPWGGGNIFDEANLLVHHDLSALAPYAECGVLESIATRSSRRRWAAHGDGVYIGGVSDPTSSAYFGSTTAGDVLYMDVDSPGWVQTVADGSPFGVTAYSPTPQTTTLDGLGNPVPYPVVLPLDPAQFTIDSLITDGIYAHIVSAQQAIGSNR